MEVTCPKARRPNANRAPATAMRQGYASRAGLSKGTGKCDQGANSEEQVLWKSRINSLDFEPVKSRYYTSHLVVRGNIQGALLDLEEFEQKLGSLIGRPTDLRPFVCQGSPLKCTVFIVGFNPATEMRGDFWDNWRTGIGFNKSQWFQAYLADRQTRPLKSGKKSRLLVSNTRRCLGWIEEEAAGVSILETNIFARPTETKAELALAHRNSEPFRFLCDVIKPQVIVAHGIDAHRAVAELETSAQIVTIAHLSRGWSQEKARALGRSLITATDGNSSLYAKTLTQGFRAENDQPLHNRTRTASTRTTQFQGKPAKFKATPANLMIWDRVHMIEKNSGLRVETSATRCSLFGASIYSNTDRIFRHDFRSQKADIRVRSDVFTQYPELEKSAHWSKSDKVFWDLKTDDLEILRRLLDALEGVAARRSP